MILAAYRLFLQVPLDYTQPNRSTAAVALLRVPSALSPQDKNYRGPILVNPGGPGGSGVEHVLSLGTAFQQLFGKEYDIVGFDPRLVSLSFYSPRRIIIVAETSTTAASVGRLPPSVASRPRASCSRSPSRSRRIRCSGVHRMLSLGPTPGLHRLGRSPRRGSKTSVPTSARRSSPGTCLLSRKPMDSINSLTTAYPTVLLLVCKLPSPSRRCSHLPCSDPQGLLLPRCFPTTLAASSSMESRTAMATTRDNGTTVLRQSSSCLACFFFSSWPQ
jgi:hypothetical protein